MTSKNKQKIVLMFGERCFQIINTRGGSTVEKQNDENTISECKKFKKN